MRKSNIIALMKTRTSLAILSGVLLVAFVIYYPGIAGDFIYDDTTNLVSVKAWVDGETSWRQAVFSNASGPFGRPVSMASFAANAALTGMSAPGFKLGNLLIHLLTGFAAFALFFALARRDSALSSHSGFVALAVTAVWLLHPMMVGTVLYVVQRMAMLSALFMIVAMVVYIHGRSRIEIGRTRSGSLMLFVGVPVFTALAALSKENGLLAPLLCAVIELVYFVPKSGRRPWQARAFLVAGAGLPLFAGFAILALKPELLLAGYINRPFDAVERLLTQGRVLFDYVGGLLLPAGPSFSLYRDDYAISTGIFSPASTLFAWIGWSAVVAMVFRLRKKLPGFSAGMGLFLVGHAMESSIIPLMIYFEHRNYLPAIGLFWAMASVVAWIGARASGMVRRPRLIAGLAFCVLLTALAAATWARANVWQSHEVLVQQALRYYPDSRAARMQMANIEMNRPAPRPDTARKHYAYLLDLERPSSRLIGGLGILAVDCFIDRKTTAAARKAAFSTEPESLESEVVDALEALVVIAIQRPCEGLEAKKFAIELGSLLDNSQLPDTSRSIWQLRYRVAELFLAAGEQRKALSQALKSWDSGAASWPVGIMVVDLLFELDQISQANAVLIEVEESLPRFSSEGQAFVEQYRVRLQELESPE